MAIIHNSLIMTFLPIPIGKIVLSIIFYDFHHLRIFYTPNLLMLLLYNIPPRQCSIASKWTSLVLDSGVRNNLTALIILYNILLYTTIKAIILTLWHFNLIFYFFNSIFIHCFSNFTVYLLPCIYI